MEHLPTSSDVETEVEPVVESVAAVPAAMTAAASTVAAPRGFKFRRHELWTYFGPAFVASVAYIDPGNFATNIEGGSRFGYRLLWVLLWSNAMAILIQYLSAKLGLVTGMSLPEVLRERMPRTGRIAFWGQAELVAIATDLAEVVGGAIALNLLFSLQAAYAAPLILLAQTRQADRDKLHTDMVEKSHTRLEHAAKTETDKLLDLLQSNTDLTREDKQLTEQVAELTKQIHTLLTAASGAKS